MISFIGIVIGSLFDPIRLVGYFLAGVLIKKYITAVTVAVAWNLTLYLVIIYPAQKALGESFDTKVFLGSVVGCILFTSIIFCIYFLMKKNSNDQEEKSDKSKTN